MAGYKTPPGTIVNTIKSLLKERYKQGFPIIKEIIQNANDGGASTLDFGVVKGLGKQVQHPLLKIPAFFFLNNGTFSTSDKEAISCFGIDANAKDKGKIGKFGLGQKSIFHFCEAFFYIARSEYIPQGCGEFINPWATSDGTDTKRPDWTEISEKDRQYLEDYLIKQKLINPNTINYFLLWVPLRQQMVDERCIIANYYDDALSVQTNLPEDMEVRIGQLLPLLRHINNVTYWLENDSNLLEQKFSIGLDKQGLERCIYPNTNSEIIEEDEHYLQGKVLLSSDNAGISFAGKEQILSASNFVTLLGQNPKSILNNFWNDLQQSSFWTKRASINEYGESENIPDKSIPHCAIVFTKQSNKTSKASLILQWSVFLPLASDDNGSNFEALEQEVYELIDCSGDKNYTIFLHGYFFLDSGRTYIEGLPQIRSSKFIEKVPINEDEMIAQWNYLLATRGTLKLFLPSLQHFVQTHTLSNTDIYYLCQAINKSQFFQSQVYRQSICSHYQWVFRIKSSKSIWELIPIDATVRELPGIPSNWEVFPQLRDLAKQRCFIHSRQPNLLSNEISLAWQEEEIITVLTSLNVGLVFTNVENINYLINFLRQQKQLISLSQIQTSLVNLLRQAFLAVDIQKLRQIKLVTTVQEIVKLIEPERRFRVNTLKSNDHDIQFVLRKMYEVNLEQTLLVYELFEPSSSPSGTSLINTEHSKYLLICLSELATKSSSQKVVEVARELLEQIFENLKSPESILNNLSNKPLFFGYNYLQSKYYIYSYSQLQELQQNKLLFRGDKNDYKTSIVTALIEALPNYEFIFINYKTCKMLDKTLALKNIPKCDPNSCLELLATKPNLADSAQRANLLRELINHA
jgi:hypothetical protein